MQLQLNTDFDTAVAWITEALKTEGFGVLTQIDVKATLKEKIDADFYPYLILGACNPSLAHQALSLAPEVGLMMPCNVIVSQVQGDAIDVSFLDPMQMLAGFDRPDLEPVATEGHAKLERVVKSLEERNANL